MISGNETLDNFVDRLTPALGALLLLTIYVFPRIGSGPLWESNLIFQKRMCSKNWWSMLLYIHNFVNTDHMVLIFLLHFSQIKKNREIFQKIHSVFKNLINVTFFYILKNNKITSLL